MLSFFAKAREETSRSRTKDRPTGNIIYHHHPSRRDVRALHKEMRRRQLLENKATSDDDDDGNDATEKESSPRDIGKKKMGRKKKYDRYNTDAPAGRFGEDFASHIIIAQRGNDAAARGCSSKRQQGELCMRHSGMFKKN